MDSQESQLDSVYQSLVMRERLLCPLAKERLVDFYRNEKFVDCTFMIGDNQVKAHKIILACNSPVFEKLFFGEMANSDKIELTDVHIEDFRDVIEFIYTDELDVSSMSHAWSLYYIANKYLIADLMMMCLDYIRNNLTLSNLVLSYEFADMYLIRDIKQRCLDDMVTYFNAIFMNYHMKPSSLRAVLDKRRTLTKNGIFNLNVNVLTWAIEECEFKDIPVCPENIYDILVSEKLLKYLRKDSILLQCYDCDKPLKMCECVDAMVHNVFEYLINSVPPWRELQLLFWEPNKISAMKFLGVRFRDIYKISQRIDLSESEEFVSLFSVNQKIVLLGVHVYTEMRVSSAMDAYYSGSICVRVTEHRAERKNSDIVKPTTMRSMFSYESEFYIPLKYVATLEPEHMYELRISYCNFTTGLPTSVVCNYMSSVLFANEKKDSELQFFDANGTLITGLCLYVV